MQSEIGLKTISFLKPLFALQVFEGNQDSDTVVYHTLIPPITAQFIRLLPLAWHNHMSLRMEVYGCPGALTKYQLKINYFNFTDSNSGQLMFHVCKITTLNYNEKTHTLESSFSLRKMGYFISVSVCALGRIKKITSKC